MEPAPVAMETFPQGREPWIMNIAFQTESARNLFEKKGLSDNNSSHLHSTLSFSPIVLLLLHCHMFLIYIYTFVCVQTISSSLL